MGWIYVAQDPSQPLGTANPIIGRYAFWTDDEASKLNLNTAGMPTVTTPPPPPDYGYSVPNEVDLSQLRPGLSTLMAAIVARQGPAGPGYTTIEEVKLADSAANADSDFTANQFSLTTYSNDANYPNYADDLDAFGRQRRPLFSAVNGANPVSVVNDITDTSLLGAYGRMTDLATLGAMYTGVLSGPDTPSAPTELTASSKSSRTSSRIRLIPDSRHRPLTPPLRSASALCQAISVWPRHRTLTKCRSATPFRELLPTSPCSEPYS